MLQIIQLPGATVSLKTLSQSFEKFTNVFAGAGNPYLTLKFAIYIGNSRKLTHFI